MFLKGQEPHGTNVSSLPLVQPVVFTVVRFMEIFRAVEDAAIMSAVIEATTDEAGALT
jgi:hypothetical protein